MSRLTKLHVATASIALLSIITFWGATVYSKLLTSPPTIAAVKQGILWGMLVLIPAMSIAGASGSQLARRFRGPIVARKARRMKAIAANGLLVLLPSAVFLAQRAQANQFDTLFYTVQILELVAGAINITLLSLNMKDGARLGRARKHKPDAQ